MENDPTELPVQQGFVDPWIGQMLSGYHVIKRIGEGGMGIVYLARHQSLDRLAAVKFLGAHMVNDASYIQRFFQEARAAATLNHPNVVSVYDAGTAGENVYYIIMEYVEGTNLRLLVQQRGRLLVPEAVGYIRQAALGLGFAHKKGIIHRDVKPDNLMLTVEGTIKIGDLGLAKLSGSDDGGMTGTGAVLGTPYYISPEQIRGAKYVDTRTDIYSLGGTLYHLLTAKIPYEGSSPAVIMAMHLNDPVPDPRKARPPLDQDICDIIQKMMAKKLEDRFQSMEAVDEALRAYQSQDSHPATRISVPPPVIIQTASTVPEPPRKRRPKPEPAPSEWKPALLGCLAAIAGIGLLAAVIFQGFRQQQKERAATEEAVPAVEEAPAPAENESTTTDEEKPVPAEEAAAPEPEPEKPVETPPEEAAPAPAPMETLVAYEFSRARSGYLPEGIQCFILEASGKTAKVGPAGIALLRGRSKWEIGRDDSAASGNVLRLKTQSPPRLKGYFFGASFYLPVVQKGRSAQLTLNVRSADKELPIQVLLGPGAHPIENLDAETDWKTFTIPLSPEQLAGRGAIIVGFHGEGRLEISDVKVQSPKAAPDGSQ